MPTDVFVCPIARTLVPVISRLLAVSCERPVFFALFTDGCGRCFSSPPVDVPVAGSCVPSLFCSIASMFAMLASSPTIFDVNLASMSAMVAFVSIKPSFISLTSDCLLRRDPVSFGPSDPSGSLVFVSSDPISVNGFSVMIPSTGSGLSGDGTIGVVFTTRPGLLFLSTPPLPVPAGAFGRAVLCSAAVSVLGVRVVPAAATAPTFFPFERDRVRPAVGEGFAFPWEVVGIVLFVCILCCCCFVTVTRDPKNWKPRRDRWYAAQ